MTSTAYMDQFPCKDIAEAYRKGHRSRALAAKYGTSPETIIGIVRREGVEVKGRRTVAIHPADLEQAVADYRAKRATSVMLAQRLGVTQPTMRRRLLDAGVEMNSKGFRVK